MAPPKKHWAKSLSEAVNLSTTIAAAVALGYFGGRWLDGKFDTEPWLAVLGFLIGMATGFKMMWTKAIANSGPKDRDEKKQSGEEKP